jgi:hypothetical protein
MWILVKNYFIANRSTFIWSIIPFIGLTSLIYWAFGSIVLMVIFTAIVYISSFMKTEEKNNTDILYRSLSIKPSSIVYSRYITAALLFVGVFLPMFLVCSFIKPLVYYHLTGTFPVMTVTDFFTITVPIAISVAGIFPFSFKYGYMKGRLLGSFASLLAGGILATILIIIVLISGRTETLTAVMATTNQPWITRFFLGVFAQAMSLMGRDFFLAVINIVTLTLLMVSVKVSVRFYTNRDL